MNQHTKHKAVGINDEVPLATLDIFSHVKTMIAAGFCGLDTLAVNNRDAWLFGAVYLLSDALAQQIVDPYQRAVLVPLLEVVEHGAFRKKAVWQ